jgi:hypothetical protein
MFINKAVTGKLLQGAENQLTGNENYKQAKHEKE